MTMPAADVRLPSAFGIGQVRQQGPPPVELPAPTFATWSEAVQYARSAFKRIHYLEGQIGNAQAVVDQAQLQLAAMAEELRLLQEAAGQLLVQGKNLA